jgi:hypothetical protein
VQWEGKTANRMPELAMLALPFSRCQGGVDVPWSVDKLGSWIDTTDVVGGGGGASHLHAVGDGGARRTCGGGGTTIGVTSLDAALISFGLASSFPTPSTPLTAREAGGPLYVTLHNNYWDTNYPGWLPFLNGTAGSNTDGDGIDRFRLNVAWSP